MTDWLEIENRAELARTTCGWPKPEHDRAAVRRYWRDVHSPAISRRAGIYQYRHSPFDPVRPELFGTVPGVELACPESEQIQWQSDVVYLDEAGMADFMTSPADPEVTAQLLGDIELLVEKSTTYKSVGDNLHTYADRTGDPMPLGPVPSPRFSVFFRQRAGEDEFRAYMLALARAWAEASGVLRVRMNLFDVPDMEAERKAGYPVKTHPVELQYNAWIDLVLEDEEAAAALFEVAGKAEAAEHIASAHAYPVPAMYTFVYGGRPTLAGLRGFAAVESIEAFGAENQKDPGLLEWMYGPIAGGAE